MYTCIVQYIHIIAVNMIISYYNNTTGDTTGDHNNTNTGTGRRFTHRFNHKSLHTHIGLTTAIQFMYRQGHVIRCYYGDNYNVYILYNNIIVLYADSVVHDVHNCTNNVNIMIN